MRCNLTIALILFFLVAAAGATAQGNASFNTTTNESSAQPRPFSITLFIPSSNMIHSDQVLDMISTPDGSVLFGTSYGLSSYKDGTWSTRHINRDNISQGLMDEFITAVELDPGGNTWIGYSGGIQIYNGIYYQTLRDTQLLKDTRIHDLQRWNDGMWVATGHSGIHRYENGAWTWFQPMTKTGPGFYEIKTMALDTKSDSLVIATVDNGAWRIRSADDPVIFEQIAEKSSPYGNLQQVRRDPNGGVYFFDDTSIVHYSPVPGFVPVLTLHDLNMADIEINDLAASRDGRLFIATDRGIYIWKNGAISRHITRFDGLGTSEIVDTINIDAQNRVWFATNGYVGYYTENTGYDNLLAINRPTPESTLTKTPTTIPVITLTTTPVTTPPESGFGLGALTPIFEPILKAINTILSKIGMGTSQ